jgi:hypothetical protein
LSNVPPVTRIRVFIANKIEIRLPILSDAAAGRVAAAPLPGGLVRLTSC